MSAVAFDGMTLTVEVGFSTSAGSGTVPIGSTLSSITWTDITSYVREVSTSRGRSSELDTYSAGSCSVVLDNRTRLFDPEYSAGSYYGKLTPLRPIRIRVTPSGGTIRSIFFGFVDQWPQSYTNPSDATVTVTASDAFKVLNMLKLPSYWNTTINAAAPTAWFPLADFTGCPNAFEIVKWTSQSAVWMSATAGVASSCTSSSGLLANESAASSSFDSQKILQITDPLPYYKKFTTQNTWSVEMWIQTTENTAGNYGIWNHGNHDGASIGMVVAAGNATIVGQFGNYDLVPGTVNTKNVQVTVNDGKPHHIVLNYSSNSSTADVNEIYVDGVSTSTNSSFSDEVNNNYSWMTLGFPINKSATAANNFTKYFKGQIQHLVVYSGTMLSAAEVLKRYQVGVGSYLQGTRTDERIQLLLDLAQWPTDGEDLGTGQSTVLGVNTTGRGLLDALKECEVAEQGRLFMSVDGKVKFVNRSASGSGNFVTSQQTFSDAPTSGQMAYSDITLTYDDRYIYNDVTTVQPTGNSYQISDTTSKGQYFARTSKVDNLIVDTGYLLANTAISRLNQYKQPAMRIDSMTVKPRVATAYQSPCVTLDIGDRVTVVRTPQGVGSAITKPLIIEGVKHTITPDDWTVTFNTSPTYNSPFVLDSALLGVLDTNILGY